MPRPTAQRLADSLEFLNQVMRGLSGEESGLALSRVTGADAEQQLKTVVQRNQQFAASVRKAIGAAEPLSKAQTAARPCRRLPGGSTAQIAARAAPRPTRGRSYKPQILGSSGLGCCCCWAPAWCLSIRRTPAAQPNCVCARTSATRKPSCACWTSCRVSRTAI